MANADTYMKPTVLWRSGMQAQVNDWRVLSEAASREQDPEKLIQLVEELNRVLLRRELQMKRCNSTN